MSHSTILSTLLALRKKRLDLQHQADLLEQEEKSYEQELIRLLVAKGADEYQEGEDIAYLKASEEPVVESWPDLLDYIARNQAFDLFQKRVTASAVKLRWKDGVHVNGIAPVTKYSLKFNI